MPFAQGVSSLMVRNIRELLPILLLVLIIVIPGFITAQENNFAKKESKKKYYQVGKILKKAIAEFDEGNEESAIIYFDSAQAIDPKNPDVTFYKSKILLSKGDTVQVRTLLEQGIANSPRSGRLNLLLARLELANNEADKALELVNNILMFRMNDGEALYIKGRSLLLKGDSAEAAIILEKALENSIKKNGH
jgi:tetratricopeptide (TPR) repeat protein